VNRSWSLLNWVCHGVLAVGLTAPCMTIVSRMGEATDLVRELGLLAEPESYSVLTGIGALFNNGDIAIGVLLSVFSVLFPFAKLVVVRLTLGPAGVPRRLLAVTAILSKYSMTDVFVIALLVIASKTLPGGSEIRLEWGTLAFATAALLSMILISAVNRAHPGT
jgi:paraquat-inducible protein A